MNKVLIVDDDLTNIKLTKAYLLQLGYKEDSIVEAEDGEEALEKLRKDDIFDYVLLDIYMPRMSGLELLDIIKNDNKLKDIPIIIFTTDDKKKAEAMAKGVDKFLVRPIDFNNFVKSISEFVKGD
jgi:CheY-like chemotaxis protein